MFGRITTLALTAAVLTATPAFADGMTQDAPTSFLGQNTAAVLSKGVSYFSAGGPAGINYATALAGGEFGLGVNGNATLAGLGGGIGLNAGYKYPLTRMGSMAAAVALNGAVSGLGGTFALGAGSIAVPLTMDLGTAMVSLAPTANMASLGNPGAVTFSGVLGAQVPVADKLSALGTVGYALQGGLTPVTLGLRLSPTATSHVDFNIGSVVASPAGVTVGTVGVVGHIGWR